ncbi:MAG: sodium:proton antiporter [Verrucomicrobiales bacterium]|jgi:Na+/H+ antiporter NhaD/arsenite permease-like protein|nr:sodium:proton antiporter [Verrucomicrobiales bacterium]
MPIDPNPWMLLPFAALLLSIAIMPFVNKRWWEKFYPLVAAGLGGITLGYYLLALRDPLTVARAAREYASFIALIGSLFIVSGGIHLAWRGTATPAGNVVFLLIGSVLANIIGTTGASMLLIRPWLRMNQPRVTALHLVFFIFTVSNIAGCLTPVGDPPLFLGYLRGVPFFWPLQHLLAPWACALALLLTVFWVLDRRNFRRAPAAVRAVPPADGGAAWQLTGARNFLWLALILAAVFLPSPWREALMVAAAAAAYCTTPRATRAANGFNFQPIREVAWLFAGIFATMMPALAYLKAHAAGLGLGSPLTFYFASGILSGVLDNAPTYLTFLSAAEGLRGVNVSGLLAGHGEYLVAISLGAVFFGALTYIGNGPNFMVKAIAEHAGVRVPGFAQYIWQYALPILLPTLILIGWLFL